MGSFHSSLLRLLLVSQERACRPYRSRACHGRTRSTAGFTATHSGHCRNMACPSWCRPLQAAGTMPNIIIWGMLWGAACGGVSFPGSNVLMRTTRSRFRSLRAGKPGEMCIPVPPAHPSQPCRCSWSEGCCSPTLLTPDAAAGGGSPAVPLFGKTLILRVPDGAGSQEPAYTAQQNSLFVPSDPYCCHMFNIVGLFYPVLTNFRQQAPTSGP